MIANQIKKNLYQDDNTRKKYHRVKFKKENLSTVKFNEKIIIETKKINKFGKSKI